MNQLYLCITVILINCICNMNQSIKWYCIICDIFSDMRRSVIVMCSCDVFNGLMHSVIVMY